MAEVYNIATDDAIIFLEDVNLVFSARAFDMYIGMDSEPCGMKPNCLTSKSAGSRCQATDTDETRQYTSAVLLNNVQVSDNIIFPCSYENNSGINSVMKMNSVTVQCKLLAYSIIDILVFRKLSSYGHCRRLSGEIQATAHQHVCTL
jgi:hypothetical protein